MPLWHLLPLLAGSLAAANAGSSDLEGSDATCKAGSGCAGAASDGGSPHYYWPSARGRHESPSRSPYKGPKNLTRSLAWTWRHPLGQYAAVIPAGPLIDDQKNIYLSTTEEIFSFDSMGRDRWSYRASARMPDTPSIWDGHVYFTTANGFLHKLDMANGQERWQKKIAPVIGGDIASVTAHDGRVYASAGATLHGGSEKVFCANASDGSVLWEVKPDTGLWNFLPMFPGDGNVVFQTENGDPYVVRISDGHVQWKITRFPFGWTDGGTTIGHNGIAYAVHADGHTPALGPTQPSDITAYRISDGKELWRHRYPTPPNSWPVFAQMGDEKRWTMMFPYGGQAYQNPVVSAMSRFQGIQWPGPLLFHLYQLLGRWAKYVFKYVFWLDLRFPWPGGVTAFEPETGEVRWEWKADDWWMPEVKGDDVGLAERARHISQGRLWGQAVCIPNPWGSPTADADGRVYLGFQDGFIYTLQEKHGKGVLVDKYETSAGFSHPGVAMAPGMLAIANCDTLYVFKYDEE